MANEEFYDSLEGEYPSSSESPSINGMNCKANENNYSVITEISNEYSSTYVLVIKSPPNDSSPCSRKSSISSLKSQFQNKCNLNSTRNENDISTLVPLYLGDTDKFQLNCRKCSSSPSPKSNGIDCSECKNSSKKCQTSRKKKRIRNRHTKVSHNKSSEIVIPEVRSKSYLKIFHSRIGYPGEMTKIVSNETQRSVFGDTKRSSVSSTGTDQFRDAEDALSDTTSYYINAIMESEQNKLELGDAKHKWAATAVAPPPSSTSEIFTTSSNSTRYTNKNEAAKNNLQPVPVMGGLGADTFRFRDKMELRKRQLQYGQRASNRNRIKLKELDILKNLKNEIEESNSIKDDKNLYMF